MVVVVAVVVVVEIVVEVVSKSLKVKAVGGRLHVCWCHHVCCGIISTSAPTTSQQPRPPLNSRIADGSSKRHQSTFREELRSSVPDDDKGGV